MGLNNEIIKDWSKGSVGAMSFLATIMNVNEITDKLEELKEIRGWKLYVLWSDLANRNVNTLLEIFEKCPSNVIIKACSTQDESGRELIGKYV